LEPNSSRLGLLHQAAALSGRSMCWQSVTPKRPFATGGNGRDESVDRGVAVPTRPIFRALMSQSIRDL
jgi:hypothetical protein